MCEARPTNSKQSFNVAIKKTEAQKTELSPETTRQRMSTCDFVNVHSIVSQHTCTVCSSSLNQTTLNYIQTTEKGQIFFFLLRLSKMKCAEWILCTALFGYNVSKFVAFSWTDKQQSEQQISKKNIVLTNLIFWTIANQRKLHRKPLENASVTVTYTMYNISANKNTDKRKENCTQHAAFLV